MTQSLTISQRVELLNALRALSRTELLSLLTQEAGGDTAGFVLCGVSEEAEVKLYRHYVGDQLPLPEVPCDLAPDFTPETHSELCERLRQESAFGGRV